MKTLEFNGVTIAATELVARASVFAYTAHTAAGNKRKYTNDTYYAHVFNVAKIVSTVTTDENMIAAAFLHDVVEDTEITLVDISAYFNQDVANLVNDLTNVATKEDGNRATRVVINLKHTEGGSASAKTIKLADVIDNTSNIEHYDPDFAKVYIPEMKHLLTVLEDGDPTLFAVASFMVHTPFSVRSRIFQWDPVLFNTFVANGKSFAATHDMSEAYDYYTKDRVARQSGEFSNAIVTMYNELIEKSDIDDVVKLGK